MSQPMRGQDGHLIFPIGPKNTNFVEDVGILLPVKFCWIPLSGFREVENVSANQSSGQPSCFSDRPEKHKLGRERWNLASRQDLLNFIQAVSAEKSQMSQPIRGQGGQLVFLNSPKNTYVVKNVEILLPVNFRWILFSGFREVENDLSDLTRTMWCDVYRHHYGYSLLINIYYKIEFVAQWPSRLASKRNIVGINLIVGKTFFFILKISPASRFLAVRS